MRQDTVSNLRPYADTILEHMPVRVALYDARDLRLLDANMRYLETLERFCSAARLRDGAIGKCLLDLLVPGESLMGDTLQIIFRRVAETGMSHHSEVDQFLTNDGKITYWNWSLEPIRGKSGEIDYLLLTGSEVTQQVLARQRAEQDQKDLYQTNTELQQERHWLHVVDLIARSIDESLDIQHIGDNAVNVIYSHFSALAVTLHISDPEQQAFRLLSFRYSTREQSQSLLQIPYERLLNSERVFSFKEPLIIEDIQGDASNMPPGGIKLPEEGVRGFICIPLWSGTYLEGMLTTLFRQPITLEGSEKHALLTASTHITAALAQARKHKEVEKERTWLHTLLWQFPESVMIVEVTSGRINYANPATGELFGITLHQMEGTLLHEHPVAQLASDPVKNGLSIEPWNFAVVRALGGAPLRNEETQLIRPDGSTVIVHMSSAPLWIAEGVTREVAIVMQDITSQKILERQKNEFLSMVNHELRTPLTVIQGFAEILPHLLKTEQRIDSLVQSAVTNIVEQSEHLVRLIEEMLDISRIEHEQFILQCFPHNLLLTLSEAMRSQGITTKQHKLLLKLEGAISPEVPLMGIFDEKRILQVLHNLIGNAIKYSPAGGNIEIGVRALSQQPEEVIIWVRDEGLGIAPNHISHIFKRFHRVSTLDRSLSGLGIGLYLVKEIITRHGGRVWVESQEGIGSTFFVTLPLQPLE